MKDKYDTQTIDAFSPNPQLGPAPTGRAMTNAERQKRYRERQKAKMAWLEEHVPLLPPGALDATYEH